MLTHQYVTCVHLQKQRSSKSSQGNYKHTTRTHPRKEKKSHRSPTTVDGRNPEPVEVGSLSYSLRGFVHPIGGDRQISEPSTV